MTLQIDDAVHREPAPPRSPLALARSHALLAEATRLIPGITQSLMKSPAMFAPGSYPVYLASGSGACVRDVDGNQYVDYVCGLGANTLGHNHPAVVETLRARLELGVLHSLPAAIEVEAARAVVELVPGAEMVRFFKTGADVTSAAVRLARHLTGREKLIVSGYHGWHDHFTFGTPGVPAAQRALGTRMPLVREADEQPLLDLLEARGEEFALLLLALPYNRVLSTRFVRALRRACARQGVLFVLDEVVTGFRIALGGAQEFYEVEADLVCLSKGLAAGMPLSAIAGPRARLSAMSELQVSTTFGGELLSLAVCCAALREYRDTDHVERTAALGRRLMHGVNRVSARARSGLRVIGWDALPFFHFHPDPAEQARLAAPFVGAMARRGVLLRRDVNFLSGAHTDSQIDATIEAVADALRELGAREA